MWLSLVLEFCGLVALRVARGTGLALRNPGPGIFLDSVLIVSKLNLQFTPEVTKINH